MVIFHNFLYVYQRVRLLVETCWNDGDADQLDAHVGDAVEKTP